MREDFATLDVSNEGTSQHKKGDKECSDCWSGYPKPCRCGGLIHAEFGDENADMGYWLYYKCDKCGDDYEESQEKEEYMRDYKNIDRYLTSLYADVYPQPEDSGHAFLSQKVIDTWMSRMTTCHSVLDVGCGTGFCQPMFEKWGISYEGVCLGKDFIEATEKGRNVKKMDFSFLEYPDNSFDLIFSRHSLEHSPMPLLTLMEWARVSGSWLGIVLPAPEWYGFTGRNHYSVMPMEQIRFLLNRAGWRVIWEEVDSLLFNQKDPASSRPHEYWIMSEKA